MVFGATLLPARFAGAQWLSRITGGGQAGASDVESAPDPAEAAFERGELGRARSLAFRHDDSAALLVRSRLAEYDGDLDLATNFAQAALAQPRDASLHARAVARVGRLLQERGKWEQAEEALRAHLAAHTDAWPVRLELGRLLLMRGARAEADAVLRPFSQAYNSGKLRSARQLAWLGEAMWLMESFDDANFAFQKMYQQDARYLDGLVLWARLLLSKYNIGDAARTLDEALKIQQDHPEALVEMARLQMEISNYFGEAREYLARAEQVWPDNPRLLAARAELQIYDADCDAAAATAEAILGKRPRDLDAFVLKAACRYLLDDKDGFEKLVSQALQIKPDLARIFTETARYAQLVHRYVEVVELSRRALKVREGYPDALLSLGIGLSRIGEEAEAIRFIHEAFAADPYNERAYNMAQLYERVMPEFEFTAYDAFRLRTHRSQTAVLNEIMPGLLREAMTTFEQKYHFKPHEVLDVEVYPKGETFGVRSVGLPQISPTGLCFGRIVISRSPSDANFNWRQVLWHEMAHVYHIQKAGYRVPRWFTEGLAEYETNVKDPSWARYLDVEIVEALRARAVPSVVKLDQSFTRASSFEEILRAYQLSSLVIHFIAEKYGFEAINRMLDEFPKSLETGRVIEAALGTKVAAFDRDFRAWLAQRYSMFNLQFLVDLSAIESDTVLQAKVARDPKNPLWQAKLAIAKVRAGDLTQASRIMQQALAIGEANPTVRYLAALLALEQGNAREAYTHGMRVLSAFEDGYPLRVLLGRTAMMLEQPVDARVHLIAAVQLYEDGGEAWGLLAKLAQSQQDAQLAARAEARLFELDQNHPGIARQRFERLAAQQDWQGAARAAERWVAVEPFAPQAQRALAQASLRSGRAQRAAQAYQVLWRLLPDQKDALRQEAARAFEDAGFAAQAPDFDTRPSQP